MKSLISAKGKDITAWRAAQDLAAGYRQVVLDRAASGRNGTAETVYSDSLSLLEESLETHKTLIGQSNILLEEVTAAPPAYRLKELTIEYYGVLYRHLDSFHSAPVFYQRSMDFLKTLTNVIMAHSRDQLGLFARHLPKMALIALGPAGRCEYSPFCQLQLLLVHEEVAASQFQTIKLYCHTLHDEFEASGLVIDPVISPRNAEWRGNMAEWRQRCLDEVRLATPDSYINVLRLADQYSLTPDEAGGQELKKIVTDILSESRPTQANLIMRIEALSNGLGMMGGLKLERSGAGRGLFNLRDHGLLPLSSAISALALIKGSSAGNSYDRILELLGRRELDVELAEKTLESWHILNELRLRREHAFNVVEHNERSFFLNPDELTAEQHHSLKTALTAVSSIQRHVGIVFAGLGE